MLQHTPYFALTPALPAAIAVACAIALIVRSQRDSFEAMSISRAFDAALLVLPGLIVVYFSFDSGGYFPASPAFAAIVLTILLILRVTLVEAPFASFSRGLAVAAAALGLFAAWILLSGTWSHAHGRALIEFDRAYAYLLLLVLVGSVARTSTRLRVLAGGLAVGVLVVAIAALATRLLPDHFPITTPAIAPGELSYPLTYSNGLGILTVLGAILFLYFATSTRVPRAARAVGAAALPILATVVYLTQSRGPVAGAFVGVLAFLLLGRPRAALTGLIATVPTSAIAVASAHSHHLITSSTPTTAAAAAQGHRVAVVVALCALGAGLLRLALSPFDRRLAEFSLPDRSRRPILVGAWATALIVVLVVGLAANAPSRISDQYDRFVATAQAGPNQYVPTSVFNPSNRGLIDNWSVSLKSFGDSPFHGTGAGTYEVVWYQRRPANEAAYALTDGHSLYTETLGELGLVGFAFLVTLVLAILVALRPFGRGPNRSLYAALFAVALAWAVHAGVDWDWEMPAVTAGVIALGGAGLAAHARSTRDGWTPPGLRVGVGLILLISAIAPALVLTSQRQLNDAIDAQRAGNCNEAVDRATASINTLDVRPDPYEVIALCQTKRGRPGFAVQALAKAVKRDPDNWRYHYDLAAVRGGAGLNPRPELLAALRLNPQNQDVKTLLADVPPGTSASWDLVLAGPLGATAQHP